MTAATRFPVRWEAGWKQRIFVRAIPDCDVGRRFPKVDSSSGPPETRKMETIGGDELLFADGSLAQPAVSLLRDRAVLQPSGW